MLHKSMLDSVKARDKHISMLISTLTSVGNSVPCTMRSFTNEQQLSTMQWTQKFACITYISLGLYMLTQHRFPYQIHARTWRLPDYAPRQQSTIDPGSNVSFFKHSSAVHHSGQMCTVPTLGRLCIAHGGAMSPLHGISGLIPCSSKNSWNSADENWAPLSMAISSPWV